MLYMHVLHYYDFVIPGWERGPHRLIQLFESLSLDQQHSSIDIRV